MSDRIKDLLKKAADAASLHKARLVLSDEPPAAEEDLLAAERTLDVRFSPSHRSFLLWRNGLSLDMVTAQAPDWARPMRILSVDQVVRQTFELRQNLEDFLESEQQRSRSKCLVACAEYLGCGDRCLVDTSLIDGSGESPVNDAFREYRAEWLSDVIAPSFQTWLEKMLASVINGNHVTYWLAERLYEKT